MPSPLAELSDSPQCPHHPGTPRRASSLPLVPTQTLHIPQTQTEPARGEGGQKDLGDNGKQGDNSGVTCDTMGTRVPDTGEAAEGASPS